MDDRDPNSGLQRKVFGCSALIVVVVLGGFIVGFMIMMFGGRESNTLVSLSPDEQWRVWLVESPPGIDRNFDLRLEDMHNGEMQTIFTSPDEGGPVGTERIAWSADSRKFVLLGRKFWTVPEADLPDGEQIYLLYDLQTREIRCNATDSSLQRVSMDDARQVLGSNASTMPSTMRAR